MDASLKSAGMKKNGVIVVPRLRELEREKQRIVSELERIRNPNLLNDSGIREISSQVSKTLLEFDNSFDTLLFLRRNILYEDSFTESSLIGMQGKRGDILEEYQSSSIH
jgi:hypothetical protein